MDGAKVSTGPLVFDTHEMGRKPGAERTHNVSIEAPADLGYDVYGVPEGSTIEIELRLEAVMDGVLATGTASAQVAGECVRCLRDLHDEFEADFQELYLYADPGEDELALDVDLLDLEPVLRDAVVLALPSNPVCDPDCGARLADDPDHTHEAAIDPRWQALGSALKELPQESNKE